MPAAMAVLAGTTAGVSAAARPDRRAQDAPTGWRRMPNDRAAATTHRPAAPNHAIVYCPVVSRYAARRSALKHLVDTFFEGSPANLVTTLIGPDAANLSDEELDRIARLIEAARKEPR